MEDKVAVKVNHTDFYKCKSFSFILHVYDANDIAGFVSQVKKNPYGHTCGSTRRSGKVKQATQF